MSWGFIICPRKRSAFHHQPATLKCAWQGSRVTRDLVMSQHLTHWSRPCRELLGEGITEAGCPRVLSPNCNFCHFLLPVHSWEQRSRFCAERLAPTIFSEDQVCVLLMLHDPGDNFHTKPDQQHPQCGIKDEINKVAKSRGKFRFQLCSYSKSFISI